MRANWQDPEFRGHHREAMRRLWRNPDYRQRQQEKMRARRRPKGGGDDDARKSP
jgi:hypothetical protein